MNLVYGLSSVQAAKRKGCDRGTIINAIKHGELTATRGNRTWRIMSDEKYRNWVAPNRGKGWAKREGG